jgi:hypothetical protein
MTGKTCTESNSVLPMDARSARIAAGGGLAASLHGDPSGRAPRGYHAAGFEPDGMDSIMPQAADSRTEDSHPDASVSNDNPT